MTGSPNQRVVIFTALDVEYDAVLNLLDYKDNETLPDGTTIRKGNFREQWDVTVPVANWNVYLHLTGYGQLNAILEVEKIIQALNPDLCMFVGIAGGYPGKVNVGDIAVAETVAYYEPGKETKDGFLPRPRIYNSSRLALNAARFESKEETWRGRIPQDMRTDGDIRFHFDQIASGELVLTNKDSRTMDIIKKYYDKAIAFETEGSGFMNAAHANNVPAIVIRGISDTIHDKNTGSPEAQHMAQRYAAYIAAAFSLQTLSRLKDFAKAPKATSAIKQFKLVYAGPEEDSTELISHMARMMAESGFRIISVEQGSVILTIEARNDAIELLSAIWQTGYMSDFLRLDVTSFSSEYYQEEALLSPIFQFLLNCILALGSENNDERDYAIAQLPELGKQFPRFAAAFDELKLIFEEDHEPSHTRR